MPGQFKSKAGATIAGHSDKWSNDRRRANSHDAGQGSRGSRNQGTGEAGKANTIASDGIDTSRMKPEEKLRYFNSLGLLGPKSNEPEQPKPQKPMPTDNKTLISTMQDDWKSAFNGDVRHSKRLIGELKEVPPAKIKKALQAAYRATAEITARESDPLAIVEYISDAITPFTFED